MNNFKDAILALYEHIDWLEDCKIDKGADNNKLDLKINEAYKAIEKLKS